MSPIPYTLGSSFISLVIRGKPFCIDISDARFNTVKDLIVAKNWQALADAVDLPRLIERFSVGNVKVYDGLVTYKGKTVGNAVVGRILEFAKEQFPFEPLARFLDKLMDNPSAHSRDQLYNYIELYKLPITEDGDFIAQKSVRPDFKDHHTGTLDNSPGNVITLPRHLCNDDPNVACGPSLHCGNHKYIQSFGTGKTILVKVNPRDVVSCPVCSDYQKLRVCRYEVLSEIESDNSQTKPFESNLASLNSYYQSVAVEGSLSDMLDDDIDTDIKDEQDDEDAREEQRDRETQAIIEKARTELSKIVARDSLGRFGPGNKGGPTANRGKNGQFAKAKAKKPAKRKKR